MTAQIKISCRTCRRLKPAQMDMYSCRYRQDGRADYVNDLNDSPCGEWLPSKSDVRLLIAADEQGGEKG